MNRRDFLTTLAAGAVFVAARNAQGGTDVAGDSKGRAKGTKTTVALVKTRDRAQGVSRAIGLLNVNPVKGRQVLLKPNFNTADPFPASTHNDTLEALFVHLKNMGAKSIILGERCGPPDTAEVMREKGIYDLCREHDVRIINFEDLAEKDWVRIQPEGSHWRNGVLVARPVIDAECVVTTCCLKTHGYGGVFTMSLKLSVGITNKKNMTELHTSFRSMRKMIAEINTAYRPSLVVMDGITAFTDKGPSHGPKKDADVIIAGTDRIAIDAVGLAVLKDLGSNRDIMERKIFDQEQISRAVELGLGVSGPERIEIRSDDEVGTHYAQRLKVILAQG
jgi:uncharacterized protein (DUF362 family)